MARLMKSVIECALSGLLVGLVAGVGALPCATFVAVIWYACATCTQPDEMAALRWAAWAAVIAASVGFVYALADEAEQSS